MLTKTYKAVKKLIADSENDLKRLLKMTQTLGENIVA
jgi:hypothetical protein